MEYTIKLDPQLDAFLQAKVGAGGFSSASDVIMAALHRLAASEDSDARLLRGLAQAEAGDDADIDEVFDRLDRRLESMEQRSPK